MTIYREIGRSIVLSRVERGYTQEQLALTCEMSVSYLRRIEHGSANPTIRELTLIATVLDVKFTNPFAVPEAKEALLRDEAQATS